MDKRTNRHRADITLDILKKAANEVLPFLKFTGEAAKGEEGIPCLDTKVWFGPTESTTHLFRGETGLKPPGTQENSRVRKRVMYTFYQKPMATKVNMLKRSAVMEGTKVSTASAEYRRMWKNMSLQVSTEEFERVTQEYTNDLAGMGYNYDWRSKVLLSAIKGYSRILNKGTQRNQPGFSSTTARRHKRVMGPSTWFHVKPKENEE